MRIKNTNEDLVLNLAQVILSQIDEDYTKSPKFLLDVVCYVLNRIKPNYIVSSRGLAHLEKAYEEDKQFIADIITLIYEAIENVSSRRDTDFDDNTVSWDISLTITKDFYFNFPQIIGKVYDSNSFDLIYDAKISLFDEDGKLVQMANNLWPNPYLISKSTPGIFTFWPKSVIAKKEEENKIKKFTFKIVCEHKDYLKEEKILSIEKKSEQTILDYIRKGDIIEIEPLYLVK
ncbi:MAG: late competence development ComFB family protein [Spirochaetes bacterium]|nr:late competence development ComFB family protein [Spirochaetota bacterium]